MKREGPRKPPFQSLLRHFVIILSVFLARANGTTITKELLDGEPAAAAATLERAASGSSPPLSALSAARQLRAPEPDAVSGGEAEHADWWDSHEDVLRQAREEFGQKHPEIYRWTPSFAEAHLDPRLREAFATRNVTMLRELIQPTAVDNVYKFQLFNPAFIEKFVEELDRHDASGIPRRRPNGMNRYGAALNDLGFDDFTRGLVRHLLTPLARTLFPRHVAPNDVTHHYPFTVRYRPHEDVQLSEHADASVVTVNVCLEPAADERVLYFKEHRTLQPHKRPAFPRTPEGSSNSHSGTTGPTFVDLSRPGQAVIHLGQIVHGVGPVAASRRSNLVVWLFAEHGDVRVAEYSDAETARHEHQMDAYWGREDDDDPLWDEL